jgi:molecular chaperone IbpA
MTEIRNALDLPNLSRFTIGMDHLFRELNRTAENNSSGYPPYNIMAVNDNEYIIELAVAGFRQEDLDITVDGRQLVIQGNIEDKEERHYVHRGISTRRFVRTFTLAEHVQVRRADVSNGLLIIELERVIPEELKPRRIPISYTQ